MKTKAKPIIYDNNILNFPVSDNAEVRKIKKKLRLKDCGTTRQCLNAKNNIFNCWCYNKCQKESILLKIFIGMK